MTAEQKHLEVQKLFALILEINSKTDYQAWFNYSGHVDVVDVRILTADDREIYASYGDGAPGDVIYLGSVFSHSFTERISRVKEVIGQLLAEPRQMEMNMEMGV